MKQILPVTALFLMVSACSLRRPISSVKPANNKTYEVEYLFEHDGCMVYRFYDQGNYVYFTNCRGEAISFSNDSLNTRIINQIR